MSLASERWARAWRRKRDIDSSLHGVSLLIENESAELYLSGISPVIKAMSIINARCPEYSREEVDSGVINPGDTELIRKEKEESERRLRAIREDQDALISSLSIEDQKRAFAC